MVIGRDAAEFGYPLVLCHYLLPSARFDVGNFLEIFTCQKLAFKKILTVTNIFKVICYKNLMVKHNAISLVKTL